MGKRFGLVLVQFLFVLLLINIIFPFHGLAQYTDGRWVLGLHGGGNIWVNDYSKVVVGAGGDVMVRYGITPGFSAGLLAGYEELKSRQEIPFNGQAASYLKLHAIPATATLWLHLNPNHQVNPYVYTGFGAMIYKRLDGAGTYIPDSKFFTSILVPVGIGLEVFPSRSTAVVADLGYRVTDDYPDGLKLGKLDGYATLKVGMNFYFGISTTEKEERARAEEQRIRDSTEAEVRRAKELADAEAKRMRELEEARRIKDSIDAEARRLAEQNKPKDTVIVLERGKTVILRGVNFEFNKATLTMYSETILERALTALNASPDLSVLIVGHTDNVGSAAYNKKLSLRRAQTVKAWLVKRGIDSRRLTVAGKGKDEPIDDNSTEEGRANNRRIEFRVLK